MYGVEAITKLFNMEGKNMLQTEFTRRKSQYRKILELLEQQGEVTNQELVRIAFRYSSRLRELRQDGYIIVTSYVSPGVFKYTYKGHKDDK